MNSGPDFVPAPVATRIARRLMANLICVSCVWAINQQKQLSVALTLCRALRVYGPFDEAPKSARSLINFSASRLYGILISLIYMSSFIFVNIFIIM